MKDIVLRQDFFIVGENTTNYVEFIYCVLSTRNLLLNLRTKLKIF